MTAVPFQVRMSVGRLPTQTGIAITFLADVVRRFQDVMIVVLFLTKLKSVRQKPSTKLKSMRALALRLSLIHI